MISKLSLPTHHAHTVTYARHILTVRVGSFLAEWYAYAVNVSNVHIYTRRRVATLVLKPNNFNVIILYNNEQVHLAQVDELHNVYFSMAWAV